MKSANETLCPLCQEKAPHWASIAGSSYYRCPSCTLIFLWPLPEPEAVKAYYEGAFAVIACRKQRSEAGFLRLVSLHRPGPTLLDVGAGWGDLITEAAEMGFQCEAVEIREDCVASLREKGFPVFRGAFHDYRPEKQYHCITMLHTLEHMVDPAGALRHASSLLAEGGVCAITVPNADSIAFRLWRQYSEWFQPGGHLFHFSPSSLERLLARERFEIVELVTRRSFAPTLPGHTLFYLPVAALKASGLYYGVRRKVGESHGSKSRSKPPLALSLLHGYLEAAHLLSLPFHHLLKPLWKWYEKRLMGDEIAVVARRMPSR